MKYSHRLLPGLLLALCACSSPNPAVPHRAGGSPSPAEGGAPEEASAERDEGASDEIVLPPAPPRAPAVARVGGEVIDIGELLSTWMHADSPGVRDLLERMVAAGMLRCARHLENGEIVTRIPASELERVKALVPAQPADEPRSGPASDGSPGSNRPDRRRRTC